MYSVTVVSSAAAIAIDNMAEPMDVGRTAISLKNVLNGLPDDLEALHGRIELQTSRGAS